MPYYQARNEQAMVHQSVGYARMRRRLGTFASAASVGPGATNMLTGAALATTNRLPALLLPSDTFATRVADPVLQQLELPHDIGLSVNDAFRPLSRFFDRVQRPGAAVLDRALRDARAHRPGRDRRRHDRAARGRAGRGARRARSSSCSTASGTCAAPCPSARLLDRARRRDPRGEASAHRRRRRGALLRPPRTQLRLFAEATGIPVGTTQAGRRLAPSGTTRRTSAASVPPARPRPTARGRTADLIIGIGTRYSDFTTASRTAFQNPAVQFVNINVASFDAYKHGTQIAGDR